MAIHRIVCTLIGLSVATVNFALEAAEIAPEGQFIANRDSNGLPPPSQQYRTRLGWLHASYQENVEDNFLSRRVLPSLFKTFSVREAESVERLPPKQRARYKRALIRDYAAAELANFDREFNTQVARNALLDVAVNSATAYVFNRFADDFIRHARKLQAQQSRDVARAAFGRLIRDIESGTYMLGSADREAFIRALQASADRFAALDAPFTTRDEILAILAGAVNSPVTSAVLSSDATGAPLASSTAVFRALRQQALRDFIRLRCGCETSAAFGPPMAWDLVLPAVTGQYRTRLGRLVAAAGKTGFTVGGGTRLLGAELAEINRLKRSNPARFGAYLAQFLFDIDTLEVELLSDARGDAWITLVRNVNMSFLTGLLSLTGSNVLSIMASAGATALGEYDALTAERKVLVTMAAWRNIALASLASTPGKCGCGGAVAIEFKAQKQGR